MDKNFQLDALDGLRGMALLLVFLSHTSNRGGYLFPGADFAGVGKSGVFLFFILSSFLLTYPFIKNGEEAMSKDFLLNYAFRRFFRVYPLYFLYILLALVSSLVVWKLINTDSPVGIPFVLSPSEFVQHLLLQQGKGVTWSILVELRFYFVLPILALTYSILLKNKLLPSIGLTLVLILLSQLIWPPSASLVNDPRLGPYLPLFLMGSLLAVIYHNWQKSPLGSDRQKTLIIEASGLAAIVALLLLIPSIFSYVSGEEVPVNYYHKEYILFGFLWSLVVFACVAGRGVLRKLFENPLLRYLGFISFSAYLLHIIVLYVVYEADIEIPIKGWVTVGVTIALSHLSWVLIEKPISRIRLRKKSIENSITLTPTRIL
ncbi:MAG: acyltransferase [Anaerolineae bacterium]|nr:acyltransferase [Anaerolineae bacterium]